MLFVAGHFELFMMFQNSIFEERCSFHPPIKFTFVQNLDLFNKMLSVSMFYCSISRLSCIISLAILCSPFGYYANFFLGKIGKNSPNFCSSFFKQCLF